MQERNGAALGRVRRFGQAQSNEAYQIRDLLTRSVVAFDWIELGSDEDCRREPGFLRLLKGHPKGGHGVIPVMLAESLSLRRMLVRHPENAD